ncbi:hypothetical protein E2F47_15910 [Mycobacterium eburneum]|nr:hypothetical protein E2F47_15910 [Mycobacterium eburneum]
MTQLDRLLAAIGVAPALPGARCRGRHRLFDGRGSDEAPEVAEQRHAQAIGLCQRCPSIDPCRAWLESLPPRRRPAGVVAGQLTQPRPVGRPPKVVGR